MPVIGEIMVFERLPDGGQQECRQQGDDLPELFFDIYVVDPLNRPVGGVPISVVMPLIDAE